MVAISGCASLPTGYPEPPHSVALKPEPTTRLARYEERFAERHGEDVSGFSAIDPNGDGLWWRLALIDSADRSLDIQYYLWYADEGGLLMLAHVIDAADRGVRVRILVDDMLYLKGKAGLANIETHPNIEIRIYNPWANKGVGRGFEFLTHKKRLNHRMHNKLLVADGQMAILGGRNVGDDYFGLGHKFNFHDLDMIVLGNAASESSQIFDYFWNSDHVIPASAFVPDASWDPIAAAWDEEIERLRGNGDLARFPIDPRDWSDELTALVDRMFPGTASVEFHRLVPGTPIPTQDGVAKLAEIVEHARHEVLIVNAYVIPGERMMEIVRDASERGVRVRILTNSLASQDVPAVTSKYKKYRKPLLEAGAELYELKANPEIQPGIVDTPPVQAEFSGLHTKAVVVDREKTFIGSLNLDPRSMRLNTEMGMIVESPGLAEQVAQIMERDMDPANSWQAHLDDKGKLYWQCDEGIVTRQPARNWWQRVEVWIMGIAPGSEF